MLPVEVEGWAQQAYLHSTARMPRRVHTSALLSPFDPLVCGAACAWSACSISATASRFTRPPKSAMATAVLPFLQGDRLAARVDLKGDRQAGVLVQSARRARRAGRHGGGAGG